MFQIFFLLAGLLPVYSSVGTASETDNLLRKMDAAYAKVKDYQASVEIREHGRDGYFKTKKFLYTFKKPNRIRLDFESPHSGMVLVYPDRNGNVVIRPWGWARFFKFHMAPDSSLLGVSSGQQIDQTDLGLLIRNISSSLTDSRRGQLELVENDKHIRVRVLADNHFREGVVTLYQFLIDKKLWLPIGVEESTPDGTLERTVFFRTLKINISVPESFFHLDGG